MKPYLFPNEGHVLRFRLWKVDSTPTDYSLMWIDNSEMGMSFGMSLARGASSSIQCGIPRKNTNRNHRKIITINDPLGHSE